MAKTNAKIVQRATVGATVSRILARCWTRLKPRCWRSIDAAHAISPNSNPSGSPAVINGISGIGGRKNKLTPQLVPVAMTIAGGVNNRIAPTPMARLATCPDVNDSASCGDS